MLLLLIMIMNTMTTIMIMTMILIIMMTIVVPMTTTMMMLKVLNIYDQIRFSRSGSFFSGIHRQENLWCIKKTGFLWKTFVSLILFTAKLFICYK